MWSLRTCLRLSLIRSRYLASPALSVLVTPRSWLEGADAEVGRATIKVPVASEPNSVGSKLELPRGWPQGGEVPRLTALRLLATPKDTQ